MASVKPFRAVRPQKDLAAKVASLPYDVMNREEVAAYAEGNPYSYLHIVRSEIDLPEEKDDYAPAVYKKAKETFDRFLDEGILLQEKTPNYYLYRQTMAGRSQTGLVATVSVDEYLDGRIKRHELTREDKLVDRINHFDEVDAHTEPVFLTYRHTDLIDDLSKAIVDGKMPLYDFVSVDGIGHTLWQIDDPEQISAFERAFEDVPCLYIADGHHRSASAARIGEKRRKEYPDAAKDAPFNRFLAVIFPDTELMIYDYNRVVQDLNGLTKEEFLSSVAKHFSLENLATKTPYRPAKKGEIAMYLDGEWYRLEANQDLSAGKNRADGLDVSLLQDNVLAPVLGIADPRTDQRIDFVGGIRGLDELVKRVDKGGGVAFAMYPPTMDDLMSIADLDLIMPPKSTWFEPKLRSGLFAHRLS